VIRVAVLGGGFMGATHVEAYAGLDDRFEVVSVYSRSPENAERVAARVRARPVTEPWRSVTDPTVDAVDVCLPPLLHREACERAFAAGKHVLVEKPIALSLADAVAIEDAAAASGRVLMVANVCRYSAEYVEVERRVASGALGAPVAASAWRLSPPPDWNGWMADPAQSGGVAVDLLVHDFDVLNWLLGPPRAVRAQRLGPAHLIAHVEHELGLGTVEGSHDLPASLPFRAGLRLDCELGTAEARYEEAGISVSFPGETIDLSGDDAYARELAAFAACVERGEAPLDGTGAQARQALAVSLAVNRALASGERETV
jgi:predicted dehydrogenase